MTELDELRSLQRSWASEVQRLRRESDILLAKADVIEVKQIDLDIAIDRLAQAIAQTSSGEQSQ